MKEASLIIKPSRNTENYSKSISEITSPKERKYTKSSQALMNKQESNMRSRAAITSIRTMREN